MTLRVHLNSYSSLPELHFNDKIGRFSSLGFVLHTRTNKNNSISGSYQQSSDSLEYSFSNELSIEQQKLLLKGMEDIDNKTKWQMQRKGKEMPRENKKIHIIFLSALSESVMAKHFICLMTFTGC